MKNLNYKIALGILLVLLLAALGFVIKQQLDAKFQNDRLNQQLVEMKHLQDGIVRSQSKYVTKDDFDDFSKKMDLDLDAIQDDLDQFDADIKGLSKVVVTSLGYRATGLPSAGTTPRPNDPNNPLPTCPDGTVCEDTYGYLTNAQHLNLNEPFDNNVNVPFGDVTFEAWKENPWSINILPRKYKLSTVLGQDEEGRHYVYNRFQIETNGETHNIPIEQSEFVEQFPESKFRFDPHINLGVSLGPSFHTGNLSSDQPRVMAEFIPALDVSFFSYGQTKLSPDWRFLGIGAGYASRSVDMAIVINPIDYNVGEHVPLVHNMYVGPTLGVNMEGQVFLGGGLRVSL